MSKTYCPFCSADVSALGDDALAAHRLACRDTYYGTSVALRAEPRLKVVLSTTACNILELLDNREDYCAARGVTLTAKGKRLTVVEAPRWSLDRLASEFDDRDDSGWDQPTSWRTSARKAAEAIREALRLV